MHLDRPQDFLKAAGATLAASTLATTSHSRQEAEDRSGRRRSCSATSQGPVLKQFQLLKEAGFRGRRAAQPQQARPRRGPQGPRRDRAWSSTASQGSVHWSSPLSSPDPAVVEKGLAAIRQSIADCKAYGGTTVLLVPAVVNPKVSHREAYTRSQANIRKLIPDAEAAGIKIAIEEVWNKFLLSAPEFARYIDEFGTPAVGAYFDVGNVVEYGYPQEWIRELGKRILKIHIKEYAKAKRFSYPLGEGEIDWPAVRSALTDVGYDGWITAEVGFGDLEAMKDVVRRMDKILG